MESDLEGKGRSNDLSPPISSSSRLSSIVTVEGLQQRRWYWRGIWIEGAQANQTHYYGPSSSTYFMHRMRSYLKEALQLPTLADPLQPDTASKIFATPASLSPKSSTSQDSNTGETHVTGEDMSRSQEEYLLNLFWLSYHFTIPILNENDFREYYNTLWPNCSSSVESIRKPSPLVDIILALCMQYGSALMPRGESAVDIDSDDPSIAGRWLYHRSQMLLCSERETPTISTLQCYIFSAMYLTNASFSNMAHKALAVAIRTAHALGLHHEAPDDWSSAELALRRRMWWTLCLLDGKACIELGRPYLIHFSDMTCSLPMDDQAESKNSGSNPTSVFGDIGSLTFHTQCVTLIITVRAIHTAFYEKCSEITTSYEGKDLYEVPDLLESCAAHLLQRMKALQTWVQNVPNTLQNPRRGAGDPFSTARSPIEIDPYIPLWLQRQRVLLELLYHNLAMSLYRPFICFPPGSTALYPISAGHSVLCLSHAAATTQIVHQVLTEADVLNGWHQTYQLQWDAALSSLGFSLAHPMCPHTPSARKAIHTAIANFDVFAASNLASAASAATLARSLLDKVELLSCGFRDSLRPSSNTSTPPSQKSSSQQPPATPPPVSHISRPSQYGQAPQFTPPYTLFPMVQNGATTISDPVSISASYSADTSFFKGLNTLPAVAPSIAEEFPTGMFGVFDEAAQLKAQAPDAAEIEPRTNWGQFVVEGNGIDAGYRCMDVT